MPAGYTYYSKQRLPAILTIVGDACRLPCALPPEYLISSTAALVAARSSARVSMRVCAVGLGVGLGLGLGVGLGVWVCACASLVIATRLSWVCSWLGLGLS